MKTFNVGDRLRRPDGGEVVVVREKSLVVPYAGLPFQVFRVNGFDMWLMSDDYELVSPKKPKYSLETEVFTHTLSRHPASTNGDLPPGQAAIGYEEVR